MEMDHILRLPELQRIIGMSVATIYRWIDEGRFPAAIELGKNSIGWRASAVQEWIASRPEVRASREPATGVQGPPPRNTGIDHSTRNAQGRTRRGQ